MRISMKDVAKAANVSQSAVSRVVNNSGYVIEEKRKRILDVIKEKGFRPNMLARSLVTNKSCSIGLCLPYLNSPFIASLMEGVEEESEKYGYDIFMSHTKEDPESERKVLSRMLDRRVDGLIVVPVMESRHWLEEVTGSVPTVILLRQPTGIERNLICAADYAAAQVSFSLLLNNGHHDIALVSGPPAVSTIRERRRGINDLLRQRGMELDPSLVLETPFDYQASYAALSELFDRGKRFTAVYALHYWASTALLRVVSERGLRIPEDCSAVAYESFEDWNFMAHTKLATNVFPAKEMGAAAVAWLHDLIMTGELFMPDNLVIEQKFHPCNSVRNIL